MAATSTEPTQEAPTRIIVFPVEHQSGEEGNYPHQQKLPAVNEAFDRCHEKDDEVHPWHVEIWHQGGTCPAESQILLV
jgi:hypothetical protein